MRDGVAIGFRVKTGRATAVLLSGPATLPVVVARRAVELCDSQMPESYQPYHAALELPEGEGAEVVRRACLAVERVALEALRGLAADLRTSGRELSAIGLVIGSDADPAKLANAHIRAHALEGRLFWQVLERGAGRLGIPCLSVVERRAFDHAAAALDRPADELRRIVSELGRPVGRPWGAEEKTAALGGWLALAR